MFKVFHNFKKRDMYYILLCALLVVTQVWLDLTMPDYTQRLTEAVSSGTTDMAVIRINGIKMLACALGSMAAAILCGFLASVVAASFARTLRERLYSSISGFSQTELDRFSTPSLITRTTNDVVQLQMLIAMGMQMIFKAPITAVWAISKISLSNVEWTYAVLTTVALMIFVIVILISLAFPRFKQIQKLTDSLNDVTRENVTGVRVVRAFNAEEYQEGKFSKVNSAITKNHLFTSRAMGFMMPVMTICMSGLSLAIYWIGAYLIDKAEITQRAEVIGSMTAFTQYALQVVGAFMMLIFIFIVLPRTMVSARRINEVLETEPVIVYQSNRFITDVKGKVEFRNVTFSYSKEGEPCLKDISFTVRPGQTFAIIGATGTGKTTLINLIPRFYDPTEGSVLIDDIDVREYLEDQLSSMVSIAPQKAILFSGSVGDNISYGSEPDEERLARAVEISHSDFIGTLEDGLDSQVAQGGTNFSGGQKQRLSIARAVYRDSEIIIFDDTFSALDYKTDMLVRRSIKENMGDKTVIIVAQRIGTIKNADKILVLHDGQIVGLGSHEYLLENCDIYKEIALSQLSEEELSGKGAV